jgi:putative acetyltransferase
MDQSKKEKVTGVNIRYTEPGDGEYLKKWFEDPETLRWFPMEDQLEIDDAVIRWVSFCRFGCSLTVTRDGIPCGIATLYLQPYRKIAHQCEFGIVVSKESRGLGIGKYLMNNILHLAKTHFKIELIHLQVYEGNPAIKFYEQFGFTEYGRQEGWIKEKNGLAGRLFMERSL